MDKIYGERDRKDENQIVIANFPYKECNILMDTYKTTAICIQGEDLWPEAKW